MITNTISSVSSVFPCDNCTHRCICKYEDDVMSFVRRIKPPEQECLSIKYECKYKTYTNLFGGYGNFELNKISDTTNNGTTSRPYDINTKVTKISNTNSDSTSCPYTIDTSSKCIDKI